MEKIPYVTEADIERWERVIEKGMPVILRDLEQGKTQRGRRYYQLFMEYRSLGLTRYCRDDIGGCREALRAAAAAYLDLLRRSETESDIKPGLVSPTDYQPMLLAIVAGDIELARQLAVAYGAGAVGQNRNEFFLHLGSAIKNAILGRPEKAMEHAKAAIEIGFAGSDRLAQLVASLYEKDYSDFEDRVIDALEEYDRYLRSYAVGTPEAAVFLDGLGLIALRSKIGETSFAPGRSDIRLGLAILQPGF